MQVEIEAKVLCDSLAFHKNVIDKKPANILNHICLEAKEGALHLASSNFEMWASNQAPCKVKREGVVAVSGTILSQIVSSVPQDLSIGLSVSPDRHVTVTWDKNRARLNGLSAEEFPTAPEIKPTFGATMDAANVKRMFQKAALAVDDVRPSLMGVFLSSGDEILTAASCDGKTLAVYREKPTKPWGEETSIIVPTPTVKELISICAGIAGDVSIGANANVIRFSAAGSTLVSRLVGSAWPEHVLSRVPREYDCEAVIDRSSLRDCIKRVCAVYGKSVRKAEFTLDQDRLHAVAVEADMGEVNDSVMADAVTGSAKAIFDVDLLSDVLGAIDSDLIVLQMNSVRNAQAAQDIQATHMSRIIPLGFPKMMEIDGYEYFATIMPMAF